MDSKTRERIRQFLVENFSYRMPDGGVADADSLLDAGILDSIAVLSLITFLEGDLGVVVGDDEVVPENLDSIESLAAFVHRKLTEGGG